MKKEIKFEDNIAASAKHIWETMLAPDTYKEWSGAAWPGSSYEGEWKEGAEIRFVSPEGEGTLVKILAYEPYHYISAEHIAVLLKGGAQDRESEMAKDWVGSTESYTFTENNGTTLFSVQMRVSDGWADMFNTDWPKALAKLKEICER